MARRCGLGLARTGSIAHHGSGEIFLAVSTARRARGEVAGELLPDAVLNQFFAATVEATEEAALNALWAAPDTTGRQSRVVRGLPRDRLVELLQAHGRLGSEAV